MNRFLLLMTSGLLVLSTLEAGNYYGPTDLKEKSEDNISIFGPADLTKVKTDNLSVSGPLDFSYLEVTNTLTNKGPVDGDHGKFGKVEVRGPVDFSYVIVSGDTSIFGVLDASDSQFKAIKFTGEEIHLDNVTADSIYFGINDSKRAEKLTLKGNTVINGDITFDSGKGTVLVEDSSVQIKGKVKGGTVTKK